MTPTTAPSAPAFPFSVQVLISNSTTLRTPAGNPSTVEISQCEYKQDVADLLFWGGDINQSALASGTPISVQWGRSPKTRFFYGYVNHAERVNNNASKTSLTQRNALRVVAVGASYFMKQTDTKSWTNYTASQVATEIATNFHLSTSGIVAHTTQWPSLQMAGQSYFQFLCSLAKRIGYTFYVNGVQLVFKPRSTNPNSMNTVVASFDYKNDPSSVMKFMPQIGATAPSGGQLANRQLSGIDPRTNQVVTTVTAGSAQTSLLGNAVATPIFNMTQHQTVDSQAEANAKGNGEGTTNQMYITATAEVIGSPFVAQGSLVFFGNANGSQNGLWYVMEADHCLNRFRYVTNLKLGRDSLGATTSTYVNPPTQKLPSATLVNGVWCAR
jgi:phage protein D